MPRAGLKYYPAASFVLNGDAEMSGTIFAEEFGLLRSPIMLTGTASNGTVYTSVIKWSARKFPDWPVYMPVVADTWMQISAITFPFRFVSNMFSRLWMVLKAAQLLKVTSVVAPG